MDPRWISGRFLASDPPFRHCEGVASYEEGAETFGANQSAPSLGGCEGR